MSIQSHPKGVSSRFCDIFELFARTARPLSAVMVGRVLGGKSSSPSLIAAMAIRTILSVVLCF